MVILFLLGELGNVFIGVCGVSDMRSGVVSVTGMLTSTSSSSTSLSTSSGVQSNFTGSLLLIGTSLSSASSKALGVSVTATERMGSLRLLQDEFPTSGVRTFLNFFIRARARMLRGELPSNLLTRTGVPPGEDLGTLRRHLAPARMSSSVRP